jgi:hypothetical protein
VDTFYYEVGYLTNNRIYAISSGSAAIFDSGAGKLSEYDYGDRRLRACEVNNGILTLTLDELSVGGGSVKAIFDGSDWK